MQISAFGRFYFAYLPCVEKADAQLIAVQVFALFSIAEHKEQEPETGTNQYKKVWRYQKWIG